MAEGPSYISSHSADVILSDIRPIKLKPDALAALNGFLDEFLFRILGAARSLATSRLRAGLLGVLPTALGKEALLEAEVELRAYWDRTDPVRGAGAGSEDDSATFHISWAFELLRLKCAAYSTLNESDEDTVAEACLMEKAGEASALVAPAALYLTAILESTCEHILSDVSRVASRDSSRAMATMQDLYTALCEEEGTYSFFKTLEVYGRIEQLCKAPAPRRSKSLHRDTSMSLSRTSSPYHESGDASNLSRDSHPRSDSRASADKGRGMRMFGRSSSDGEGGRHRRSNSGRSNATHQTDTMSVESELQEEFDELMRNENTMKVSLTPDRLRTMDVYKAEKDQRNRRPAPLSIQKSDSELPSAPRVEQRRPSNRHVESIAEGEEDAAFPSQPAQLTPSRPRGASVATTPERPIASAQQPRTRTLSAAPSHTPSSPTDMPRTPHHPMPGSRGAQGFNADPYPQKTRRVQRNRESMDLDDIMNGSDDEEEAQVVTATQIKAPQTPVRRSPPTTAGTRELIDFLNDGPPDARRPPPSHVPPRTPVRATSSHSSTPSNKPAVSKATQDMIDFLAQGPPPTVEFSPNVTVSPSNDSTSSRKGSGRLVRMMSKLSMNDRRERAGSEATTDTPNRLAHKTSMTNLPPAVKPVPPRYPLRPISPPPDGGESSSAPSPQQQTPRARLPSSASNGRREPPVWERDGSRSLTSSPAPSRPQTLRSADSYEHNTPHHTPSKSSLTNGTSSIREDANESRKPTIDTAISPTIRTQRRTASGATSPTRKPVPPLYPTPAKPASSVTDDDLREMRRLFAKATSPEECRLIFDLFLAKSGVTVDQAEYDNPYPSPSSDYQNVTPGAMQAQGSGPSDAALEKAMVEMLLGGGPMPDVTGARKLRAKRNLRGDGTVANSSTSTVSRTTSASATMTSTPIASPTPAPTTALPRPPSAGAAIVSPAPRVVMQKMNRPADPVAVQAMTLL